MSPEGASLAMPDCNTTRRIVDAQRDLAAANLAEYIRRTVAAAPPLSDEQCDRLSLLLRGPRGAERGAA